MKKNKFTTYLLYAIGDIFFVVIGILIAVSINNWNEQRKISALETNILQEISEDLKEGLASLEEDIEINKIMNADISHILNSLETPQSVDDSLDFYFGYIVFNTTLSLKRGGYDNLKNVGLSTIANDSLRQKITSFYENAYAFIEQYAEKDRQITQEYFTPLYLQYFESLEDVNTYTNLLSFKSPVLHPKDLEQLRTDKDFSRLLSFFKYSKREVIYNLSNANQEITALKESIDHYLKEKDPN